MPAQVIVYTTKVCPYCVMAKTLLTKKNVAFREVLVDTRPELRTWLVERSKQRTVPQIFVNGESLGGFSDISELEHQKKLDELLARDPAPSDPEIRV
jgi:glutaredoxin 3